MSLRIPAIIPRAPEPAPVIAADPAQLVVAMFEHVLATAMHDLPFINPEIRVEAVGFRRVQGDWVGVVVTPWSISLLLLNGGGELWEDIPTGEHRQLAFPAGPIEFIGENKPEADAAVRAYQYCPLITPVQHIPDHASACAAAAAVMQAVFEPPPAPEEAPVPYVEPGAGAGAKTGAAANEGDTAEARRAFLRGFVGRR